MTQIYDVAIIGAGAVGSAIARELSRYELNIVLLESKPDVGMGTSKASTALWHTGYDATPGSLESALLKRSYPLLEKFMMEVGSPFERIGGLLIAWTQEQFETLPSLLAKAHKNGDTDVYITSKEELYQREAHLGRGALGGMFVPGEGILCTFTIPLACATQAVANEVMLKLNFAVRSIKRVDDFSMISSGSEEIQAKWVINAAGLYSDEINQHFGHENFKVTPRRGELIVYDKLARPLVNHVLLPVPTAITKGVLISPTIYGNVLLGPTAEDLPDKAATNTSADGLQSLLEKGEKILPDLLNEEVTATYAGLRAATEHSDYQIALHADQQYICVGGIRSTGISASLGIAEYVADLLKEGGVELRSKSEFKTIRMPNIGEAFLRPYQSGALIAENAHYGLIVCHCERVTVGEIHDAMNSVIPATTLDALRRRTRAMQGRCQGFNCHASLVMSLRAIENQSPVRSEIPSSTALRLHSEKSTTPLTHLPDGVSAPSRAVPGLSRRTFGGAVDVLIVGAGPAGIAAALELKKLGVDNILIAEREPEAGGIPRMCGHIGFGLSDLHRVMTGPSYARKYREMADRAGIKIHTSTTITGWNDDAEDGGLSQFKFTSPDGVGAVEAKSVLLVTGVRERPRSARLVPGYRPQGIFTTGSLQRFVYEHELPVGKHAVIIGAERVSLSVVLTLMHAGVRVLNMITELPNHQLYLPVFLPAKILFADILARARILTNTRATNIFGHQRVEGIEITDLDSGKIQVIECDTIVFTGDWIPENELVRKADVKTGKPALGPQVDSRFRTSQPGIFAAGNLLRGVETADWAALEGRSAARSIARFLKDTEWNESRLEVHAEPPLDWICPNVLSPDALPSRFRLRSYEFRNHITLKVMQGQRLLYSQKLRRLLANTSINLSGEWAKRVDFSSEPLKIEVADR
ncbi:MAG TPA: FAD-dependent oxidoreductase [Anaerolineales bacterium]|nr:FAD-dependent oxidoreductase [Anaerolineales bacterium]